jgi:hypothetical protein
MVSENVNESGFTGLEIKIFQESLESKMSSFNAKMILDSAFVTSGLKVQPILDKTQSHCLCMELIKKGGPAFRTGIEIYKKYLQ